MCFSSPASFAVSAGLFVIGAIALKKSVTAPQRVFASIPVLFALQQFCEGIVWISVSNPRNAAWSSIPIYAYLFFAQIVWPCYVPFSMLLLEQNPKRKIVLRCLFGIGLLTSAYLLYCLFAYPVSASAESHHLKYDIDFLRRHSWFNGVPYILAAVVSPFVSGVRRMWLFGVILLGSYIVTRIFYQDYIISIWCYFAASLSFVVLAIIVGLRKKMIAANVNA